MAILINLNDARKKLYELEGSAEYNKGVTDAFNALFDLPTIEAESRKRGRWETEITTNKDGTKSARYACSVCGVMALDEWHHCPNCGAKMDLTE